MPSDLANLEITMLDMKVPRQLLALTADIVAAHVSNNSVAVMIADPIQNVHSALSTISDSLRARSETGTESPIRSSIKPDYMSASKTEETEMLKRIYDTHIKDARPVSAEWGLNADYPWSRQLCRAAPCDRQVYRSWHQAPQNPRAR